MDSHLDSGGRIVSNKELMSCLQALEENGEGRVLVVDGGGSKRCALLGDNIAEMGYKNGWSVSILLCVGPIAPVHCMSWQPQPHGCHAVAIADDFLEETANISDPGSRTGMSLAGDLETSCKAVCGAGNHHQRMHQGLRGHREDAARRESLEHVSSEELKARSRSLGCAGDHCGGHRHARRLHLCRQGRRPDLFNRAVRTVAALAGQLCK